MSDFDGLLQRHQSALCLGLSLVVGVVALLEPLTAHAGHDEGRVLLALPAAALSA